MPNSVQLVCISTARERSYFNGDVTNCTAYVTVLSTRRWAEAVVA
jgi:hypothetical protein